MTVSDLFNFIILIPINIIKYIGSLEIVSIMHLLATLFFALIITAIPTILIIFIYNKIKSLEGKPIPHLLVVVLIIVFVLFAFYINPRVNVYF